MSRKKCIFIGVVVIPIIILLIDFFLFPHEINHVQTSSQQWNYILKHQCEIPPDLLKLAQKNEETLSFVAHYLYHQDNDSLTLEKDLQDGQMPALVQWDERWGYKIYGQHMLALNGNIPTCLSMVLSYLKQNPQYHPYAIAKYAYCKGYYIHQETSSTLLDQGARAFGLNVKKGLLDEMEVKDALQNNHPIICEMQTRFDAQRRFVVLRSYEDGLIYIHDPESLKNTNKGYCFSELKEQIVDMWIYSI